MNPKIQEYINHTLSQIAIIEEAEEVGFEDIKIYDFRTHHENGKDFVHQNGGKLWIGLFGCDYRGKC